MRIGEIITDDAERDAIHVAVVPIIAGTMLHPGERVFIATDGKAVAHPVLNRYQVGVVDPFLAKDVEMGERFWLFVTPGTTGPMRHEWHHPGIPDTNTSALAKALEPEKTEPEQDEDDRACHTNC